MAEIIIDILSGRIMLPRLNILIGERRVIYLYLAAALAFEMVVWFSNNLYAAAICTSLVGFVIGVSITFIISSFSTKIEYH